MAGEQNPKRPPLVLIANREEWSARSIESILGPGGYAVLRAYSGEQTLNRAQTSHPDIIVLDSALPDMTGIKVCAALRERHLVSASTPIIMTTSGRPTRRQRIEALRAGAWDFLGHPLDAEELLLRLDAFAQAKLDADRAREESLVDQLTGLYNVRGLARRVRELGSEAYRNSQAMACVVFGPEFGPETGEEPDEATIESTLKEFAHTFRASGRISDAIGRLGRTEFAVVAAGTDEEGAERLARRIMDALSAQTSENAAPMSTRAGYYAVPDFRQADLDPVDMLVRATTALRMAKADGDAATIKGFSSRAN